MRHAQLFVEGFQGLACAVVGGGNGRRFGKRSALHGVEGRVGGVDEVGHFAEHRRGDGASIVAAALGVCDDHHAGILGVVCGEVSGKRGAVAALGVALSCGDARGSCFPSHRVGLVFEEALGGAFALGVAHHFHHGFAGRQRGFTANPRVEDEGFVRLHHLVARPQFTDKLGAHHAAVVGHGVVQGEGLKGGLGEPVANGHGGQAGPLPLGVVDRGDDLGRGFTHVADARLLGHANGIEAIEEGLGLVAEGVLDR